MDSVGITMRMVVDGHNFDVLRADDVLWAEEDTPIAYFIDGGCVSQPVFQREYDKALNKQTADAMDKVDGEARVGGLR